MLKILTPAIPILIGLYLAIDVIIPAFFTGDYFWFAKSFFKKKQGAEKDLAEAEKAFNEAFETLKSISVSNTEQYEKAKQAYDAARDMYEKAREVYENFKQNKN